MDDDDDNNNKSMCRVKRRGDRTRCQVAHARVPQHLATIDALDVVPRPLDFFRTLTCPPFHIDVKKVSFQSLRCFVVVVVFVVGGGCWFHVSANLQDDVVFIRQKLVVL